jgi:hypothetical protein
LSTFNPHLIEFIVEFGILDEYSNEDCEIALAETGANRTAPAKRIENGLMICIKLN